MRLTEWRLAVDEETFAYAGDEVEVSVWNTDRAFSSERPAINDVEAQSKKRKRSEQLLPGEIWRAKNVRRLKDIFNIG
jgi:ribosome biogenesis protein NSA1